MFAKEKHWLCLALVVLVCLTRVHTRNIESDTVPLHTSMQSDNPVISDTDICAAELLGVCSSVYTRQLSEEYTGHRREHRLVSDFLYADIYTLVLNKFVVRSEEQCFPKYLRERLVLSYIHDSDGKKRIS